MDKKEFSECVNVVKLLTSSIFARKLNCLTTTCKEDGLFYYSNIPWERIVLYRPDISDGLSKVKVTNETVVNAFYTAFPSLKEMSVEFNIPALSSALNKYFSMHKKELKFPELIIPEGTREIRIDAPSKVKNKITKEDIYLDYTVVGIIVPDDAVSLYEEVITNYRSFSDDVRKYEFRVNEVVAGEKVALEMIDLEIGPNGYTLGLPIADGFSMVSTKEYIKKRDGYPLYGVDILVNDARCTAKALINFADDWLTSTSIMPGSLWFLRKLAIP